jgi:hypothetical protein
MRSMQRRRSQRKMKARRKRQQVISGERTARE